MVNPNSWYVAMHYDRLNEELLENTYGKRIVDPLDVLKKRLAKGEITKEEFDRMKNDLD